MGEKIDLYDKKILHSLCSDSRISASAIGRKIRMSKESVNYRIKNLIERGYVKNFYSIINASKIGYYYFKVSISLIKISREGFQELISFLKKEESCINIRETEGNQDIVFYFIAISMAELTRIFRNIIDRFGEKIISKEVHFVIKSIHFPDRFLISDQEKRLEVYHEKREDYNVDPTDMKIINFLSRDSGRSIVRMSRKIGVPPKNISYHIKKLEEEGIIVKNSIGLDLARFKRQFIQMDISLIETKSKESIIEFFDHTKSCLFCCELLGKYDISFELFVKDNDHLKKILDDFNSKFLKSYSYYDISYIFNEHKTAWFPIKNFEK